MVAIEFVTNRSHLILMEDTSEKFLIRVLETLQKFRGQLSTIVMDKTKYHQVLKRDPECTLTKLLLCTNTPLMVEAGVTIVIALGKHHEKLDK